MAKTEITQYGFTFGPATIERACSDDKSGWVMIVLKTAKHPNGIQLIVTKSGKVRIFGKDEWTPPKKEQLEEIEELRKENKRLIIGLKELYEKNTSLAIEREEAIEERNKAIERNDPKT